MIKSKNENQTFLSYSTIISISSTITRNTFLIYILLINKFLNEIITRYKLLTRYISLKSSKRLFHHANKCTIMQSFPKIRNDTTPSLNHSQMKLSNDKIHRFSKLMPIIRNITGLRNS